MKPVFKSFVELLISNLCRYIYVVRCLPGFSYSVTFPGGYRLLRRRRRTWSTQIIVLHAWRFASTSVSRLLFERVFNTITIYVIFRPRLSSPNTVPEGGRGVYLINATFGIPAPVRLIVKFIRNGSTKFLRKKTDADESISY